MTFRSLALVLSALASAACDDSVASKAMYRDAHVGADPDAVAPKNDGAPPAVDVRVINQSIFDVTAFGARGDGVADDTGAIQRTIDAAANAGGGRVFFPLGKYRVSGALQDPGRANAQIVLPSRPLSAEPLPIVLEGPFPPATNYSLYLPEKATERGAVLISDHHGGGNVIGAMGPPGTFEDFSNISAIVRNLIIRTYGNPDTTALNLGKVFSADVSDVVVDTGFGVINDVPEPTHPTACGIIAPLVNNGALVSFNRVQVVGYYVGVRFSEHFTANLVQLWACKVGLEASLANHASYIQRGMVVWSAGGLRATGAHPIRIDQLAIEHRNPTRPPAGAWMNPAPGKDIDDPRNQLFGTIEWYAVKADVGRDDTLGVTGGANLTIRQIGAP